MVFFPLHLLRYLLLFSKEYRIICNRLVNIEKLIYIPQPIFNFEHRLFGKIINSIYSVELEIFNTRNIFLLVFHVTHSERWYQLEKLPKNYIQLGYDPFGFHEIDSEDENQLQSRCVIL